MNNELRLGSPSLSLQEAPCVLAFCNGELLIAPRVLVDATASSLVINLIPSWWYLCVIFWAHDLLLCPDSYFVNSGWLIYVSWTTKVSVTFCSLGTARHLGSSRDSVDRPLVQVSEWPYILLFVILVFRLKHQNHQKMIVCSFACLDFGQWWQHT